MENQKKFEISYLVKTEANKEAVLKVLSEAGVSNVTDGRFTEIKLAYPIKKHTSAFFGSSTFEADPAVIDKLDKSLKFMEEVLRFLIISAPSPKNRLRFSDNHIQKQATMNNIIEATPAQNIETPIEQQTEISEPQVDAGSESAGLSTQAEVSDAILDEKLAEILNGPK